MIRDAKHAIKVQERRRDSGNKGRAKAVRRWFKRTYGRAVEAHSYIPVVVKIADHLRPVEVDLCFALDGDFTGCRSFDETHLRETKNPACTRLPKHRELRTDRDHLKGGMV
jgi:hypothetical protein